MQVPFSCLGKDVSACVICAGEGTAPNYEDLDERAVGIQRSAKRLVRGCEKFVPALAYLLCLPLPGSCLARFAYLLADLCR